METQLLAPSVVCISVWGGTVEIGSELQTHSRVFQTNPTRKRVNFAAVTRLRVGLV